MKRKNQFSTSNKYWLLILAIICLSLIHIFLKRDTRHFAKRQLTWFRRERDVNWIQKEEFGYDEEKILQAMLVILKEKEIID